MVEEGKSALDAATVLVALITASIALWAIYSQRIVSRRRGTLEYLSSILNDHDYIKAHKIFVTIANSEMLPDFVDRDISNIDVQKLNLTKEELLEAHSSIDLVMNNFELISIGLQRGVLDYMVIRHYMRTIIVTHWIAAQPYILKLQVNPKYGEVFVEFRLLYGLMVGTEKMPLATRLALVF
jgi:hypothetical protein